ncbi:UNVERIFIED_CONTAM: putative RNA-dependent RNA polymerase 5 [Sesamum angustifolium]|uniref:RNA-dependent RNA polymerase 5 n=1 Tax=Sesamum angustifolium TaxID=2727405 RepID=A0AAW2N4Y8_9LAMI
MDGSPHQEAPLPHFIEKIIQKICKDQSQPPITFYARKLLADIGEKAASDLLASISNQRITKSFSGYIITMVKKYHPAVVPSPPCKRSLSPSSSLPRNTSLRKSPLQISRLLSFEDEVQETRGPISEHQTSSAVELKNSELREMTKSNTISQQLRILSKLEYRKLFLVLSYTGRHKLENIITVDGANDIFQKKDLPMSIFETAIWNTYGNKYCDKSDRVEYLDWDSGKTHLTTVMFMKMEVITSRYRST